MTATADIGVIGLGVMGRNLALNLADKDFNIAMFDLWQDALITCKDNPDFDLPNIHIYNDLSEFIDDLKPAKVILLMVKAGETVDRHIELLIPNLSEGDIVIDGGNSHYHDTERRHRLMKEAGLHFVGLGVSGGETGARNGPAMMAGATEESYARIQPMLSKIAARANDGVPCVARFGSGGAGHFVKTIHNGIEYADMQLIAEMVSFLRSSCGLTNTQAADVLRQWDNGLLSSYLIEITAKLLVRNDHDTGKPLVDMILDKAGQKGTGLWSAQATLELGVPAPSILEAVSARALSSMKEIRIQVAEIIQVEDPLIENIQQQLDVLENAMVLAKYAIYAQGLSVINAAAEHNDWPVDLATVAQTWRAGCIIRADILDNVVEAYQREHGSRLPHLMLAPAIAKLVSEKLPQLRQLVAMFVVSGCPAPVLSSTLSYIESLLTADGSANIIQAQRDFFGAHHYKRIDKEGDFHTDWQSD